MWSYFVRGGNTTCSSFAIIIMFCEKWTYVGKLIFNKQLLSFGLYLEFICITVTQIEIFAANYKFTLLCGVTEGKELRKLFVVSPQIEKRNPRSLFTSSNFLPPAYWIIFPILVSMGIFTVHKLLCKMSLF